MLTNFRLLTFLRSETFGVFVFKGGGILSSFVFSLLIARLVGASENGFFSIQFTFLMIISMIGKLGLDTFLVKEVASKTTSNQDIKKLYVYLAPRLAIVISLLSIIAFGGGLLARWVGWVQFETFMWVITCSTVLPFSFIDVNSAFFQGMRHLRTYAFFTQMAKFSLSIVLLLILVFTNQMEQGLSVVTYGISCLLLAVGSGILLLVRIQPAEGDTHSAFVPLSFKETILQSYPMLISASLVFVMGWIDTLMLGYYVEASDVGIYSACLKIATLVSVCHTVITAMVAPRIAAMHHANDTKGVQSQFAWSARWITLSTLPIFIMIVLFGSYMLEFFGKEFEKGYPILIILSFGLLINSLAGAVSYGLQMTGYQDTFKKILLIAVGINFVLNYTLVKAYGMTGVATASVISYVFWTVSGIYAIWKKMGYVTFYLPFRKKDHE